MRIEEAAITADVTQRALFRRIEAGGVHFTENSEGAVLVCLNSLLQAGGETQEADAHLEKDYGNGDQAGAR